MRLVRLKSAFFSQNSGKMLTLPVVISFCQILRIFAWEDCHGMKYIFFRYNFHLVSLFKEKDAH
jgi:hypothetical protein